MSANASYEWQMEVLGDNAEYPGHPVVLAAMVMDRYQSFEHAKGYRDGAQYYNAISDSFIPGAGCAVSSTMTVLKLALEHGPEAAFKEAERYWQGWENQSPRNKERAENGRRQAELAKPLFRQRLQWWRIGELPPSKWRLEEDAVELA
ncbi:MAG: hypothetical protein E6R08_00510 [Nevskiaceae bacterium]|nr:MAG: hypothetical protein E6R08_00510 [Nevskiaceae bacterium]